MEADMRLKCRIAGGVLSLLLSNAAFAACSLSNPPADAHYTGGNSYKPAGKGAYIGPGRGDVEVLCLPGPSMGEDFTKAYTPSLNIDTGLRYSINGSSAIVFKLTDEIGAAVGYIDRANRIVPLNKPESFTIQNPGMTSGPDKISFYLYFVALKDLPPGNYVVPKTKILDYKYSFRSAMSDTPHYFAGVIAVGSRSCKVNAPSVVSLPSTDVREYPEAGSISHKDYASFDIAVDCGENYGVTTPKVDMVLSDKGNAANVSNVLTNTAATETASNMRIALFEDKAMTKKRLLGPDSDAPGTVNSFAVGEFTPTGESGVYQGGHWSVPMVATYYLPALPGKIGKVGGVMTYTLIYK